MNPLPDTTPLSIFKSILKSTIVGGDYKNTVKSTIVGGDYKNTVTLLFFLTATPAAAYGRSQARNRIQAMAETTAFLIHCAGLGIETAHPQ